MTSGSDRLMAQYRRVVLDGCGIDYRNRLSVCKITDYKEGVRKRPTYQVHCEDSRFLFSHLYYNINEAMLKFFEIKKKINR